MELFFELVYCNRTFFTYFLQSQSHCYKGAITLRQGCNHPHFGFAIVLVAIAAHQWLQPHRNRTLPIFLQLFFLQSQSHAVFLQLFFLQIPLR
jgi:hypothetical protein